MNDFDAKAEHRRGGWVAMVRFARDGELKPILEKTDKPRRDPSELLATKAALSPALAYFNGHLVASREIAGPKVSAIEDANSVFKAGVFADGAKIVRLNDRLIRKGKVIPVERGRSRRAV